jgi:pyruvate dehydrogenase E2 component (dihydrolipoamide acetyltransferase)
MRKIAFSSIRGTIAQYVRLATNVFRPFFSIEVKADRLEEYRLEHEGITYTPLLMKVIAATVKHYPLMNAVVSRGFWGIKVFVPKEVDICFAVEKTYKGETFVAVPVIRDVDKKSIQTITDEIQVISELPYEKLPGIKPVLLFHKHPYFMKYGYLKFICRFPRLFKALFGTIAFSNLGKFGVQVASPTWINTVIFGIGSIEEKPVVLNGEIKSVPILHITMGFDHAVFDGAEAGRILQTVKELIEQGNYDVL